MSKNTDQVHNISELIDFMKENFKSDVYHSLNDVKKDFDLRPKEDYKNISTCTEFCIKETDHYYCFVIKDRYEFDSLVVAQCYINGNIKYIFIPEDVVQYKEIQKFMPFNEQSKQNFQNSFDEILRQNNLPSGGIDRNQFCFLIKKIYGATIIDEKSTQNNKLSQICSSEEIGQIINDERQVCFLIDGERFFIPKDECGVIIQASFSNEKLISLKYSYNGFKYAKNLCSLIDVNECMKLLL